MHSLKFVIIYFYCVKLLRNAETQLTADWLPNAIFYKLNEDNSEKN